MSGRSLVCKGKVYELVPPDGGWGYMIWIAASINFITVTLILPCFGLLFNDFLKDVGANSTSVMLLNGVNAMCMAVASLATGSLLKFVSIRKLAFIATAVFNLGVLIQVFVTSTTQLILCQGLFQNTAVGVIYNLTYTIINEYFLVKRLLSMSVCFGITNVFQLLSPIFVKWSLEEYGFRGTLLFFLGVTLHSFIACALMQPVERHLKKVEVVNEIDSMPLIKTDETLKGKSQPGSDSVKVKVEDFEGILSSEKVLLNSLKTNKQNGKESKDEVPGTTKLSFLIHPDLVGNYKFLNAALGMAFMLFAEIVYSMLLPLALFSDGWKNEDVALALTLYPLGELMAKGLLIISSKWITITNHNLYLIGMGIALFARLGYQWTNNVHIVYTYLTFLGVGRCFITVLMTPVLADCVPNDAFPSAIGICTLMYGLASLIVGPAIGAVRDLTCSYDTTFYLLTSIIAVVLMFWCVTMCYFSSNNKARLRSTTA